MSNIWWMLSTWMTPAWVIIAVNASAGTWVSGPGGPEVRHIGTGAA